MGWVSWGRGNVNRSPSQSAERTILRGHRQALARCGAGLAKPPIARTFAWHGSPPKYSSSGYSGRAPTRRKRGRVSPRSGTRGGRNCHGPDPDSALHIRQSAPRKKRVFERSCSSNSVSDAARDDRKIRHVLLSLHGSTDRYPIGPWVNPGKPFRLGACARHIPENGCNRL